MSRSPQQVDSDLATLENTVIPGIRSLLGPLPAASQGNSVAERLTALEKFSSQLGKLTADMGSAAKQLQAIDAKLVDMSAKIKLDRMIFLGYAIAGALVKVDVQAIKIDLTLLKKIDEKNVFLLKKPIALLQEGFTRLTGRGNGSVYQKTREALNKERKAAREAAEREEKEKESRDERLKKEIEGLPKTVAAHTRDIDKLFTALRGAGQSAKAARDDRSNLAHNHKGVDAKKPTVGPVAKDVKNLRSAVDELIASLGSL
ncbi:hypothetical protein ACFVQ4_12180 [Streptomyces laurentii]|uniref:hypothetical protein n=1 Tax=Streptomyces laurentii TaxID=39478 RepID=UPI00368A22E0